MHWPQIMAGMDDGRKSRPDRFWTWLTRINATVSLAKTLAAGLISGGGAVLAGILDASWKVILPLCVVSACFLIPGAIRLFYDPARAERMRRNVDRPGRELRLVRVIEELRRLAEAAPLGYAFNVGAANAWYYDASKFVRDSLKESIASQLVGLPASPNEYNVEGTANSLRGIAANLTIDDLCD